MEATATADRPFRATIPMPGDAGFEPRWEWRELEVGKLTVPAALYQREFNQRFADWLLANWRPWEVLVLVVAFIEGIWYVVDGQHRLWPMRQLGVKTWMCEVLYGFSTPEQARTFVNLNRNRRAMAATDLFRADVHAEDPDTLAIAAIVEEAGFALALRGHMPSPRAIRSVGMLRRIYMAHGADTLRDALRAIRVAWTDREGKPYRRSLEAHVIGAVGVFIGRARQRPQFSLDHLIDRMHMKERTPSDLIIAAKERSLGVSTLSIGTTGATGSGRPMLDALLGWYDAGLSKNKLQDI